MNLKVYGNGIESKSNPLINIKTCIKCGLDKRAEVKGNCKKCKGRKFKSRITTLDDLMKEAQYESNLTQAKLLCMESKIKSINEQIVDICKNDTSHVKELGKNGI